MRTTPRAAGLAAPARRISNAPAYQMWLSAVGLQPQDNVHTYPWIGIRIGAIGDIDAG